MTVPAYLLRFVPLASANVALGILALERMWHWFVAPLGVPDITYAHAFGLRLAVFVFAASGRFLPPAPEAERSQSETRSAMLQHHLAGILTSVVVLLVGWALR